MLGSSVPAEFSLGMSDWLENVLEDNEEERVEEERRDRQHTTAPSYSDQDSSRGAVLVDSKELTVSQVHDGICIEHVVLQ